MSSGNSVPTEAESRRAWAAEFLEQSSEMTAKEAQSQWLRNLEEQDFVPYEGSYEALQVLAGRSDRKLPTREYEIQLYHERELLQAVESMADTFFQYAPDQRRERWESLEYKCRASSGANSRAKAQLALLRPGLDMPLLDQSDDQQADDLVRLICQLFTLNPLRRAQRMQELWNLAEEDPAKWEAAAKRVERDRPQVATLLPREFKRLTTLQASIKREANYVARRIERAPVTEEAASSSSGSGWWIPVVIAIAIGAVGSMLRNDNSRPKPQRYTPFNNTAPSEEAMKRLQEILKRHGEKFERDRERSSQPTVDLGEEVENRIRFNAQQKVDKLLSGPLSEDADSIPYQDGRSGSPAEKVRLLKRLAEITRELTELEEQAKERQRRLETDLAAEYKLMSLRAENERLWKRWKEMQNQDVDEEPAAEEPSTDDDIFKLSP